MLVLSPLVRASQSIGLETSMTLVSTRLRHVVVVIVIVMVLVLVLVVLVFVGLCPSLRHCPVVVVGLRGPIGQHWCRRCQLLRRTDPIFWGGDRHTLSPPISDCTWLSKCLPGEMNRISQK